MGSRLEPLTRARLVAIDALAGDLRHWGGDFDVLSRAATSGGSPSRGRRGGAVSSRRGLRCGSKRAMAGECVVGADAQLACCVLEWLEAAAGP